MKRLVFLILLTFLTTISYSQKTLLQGNAFSYRGQNIEIHSYLDLFTFRSMELANQYIPENGNFRFELDIKASGLYLVKIGKINAHVFIVPGDEYTLVIPEPYEEDIYGPAKDIFVMPEVFESKYKLNYDITKVEQTLNQFIIDNREYYRSGGVSSKIRKPVDSLITKLGETYKETNSIYFKDYLFFRFAEFELVTGQGLKTVYNRYFKDRTPAYNQLSYSNAFNNFYRESLYPSTTKKYSNDLELAIRDAKFSEIDRLIQLDTTLKNKEIRSLLIANQLYLLGAKKIYKDSIIQVLLDSVKIKSGIREIAMIAQNAQEILMTLASGTRTPDFKFTDVVGNLHRFDEYAGSLIYIQFFDRFTPEVLREMSLMKVLKDGYGADVAFFSISLSESNYRLKQISEDQKFDWFFGKATSSASLREAYDLRALPSYFFINKEMLFLSSPAPAPGFSIEKAFAKEWQRNHPNKPILFKLEPPEVQDEKLTLPPGVDPQSGQ